MRQWYPCQLSRQRLCLLTLCASLCWGISSAEAFPNYLAAFHARYGTAASRLDSCKVCHINNPPSGPADGQRNPYGLAFQAQAGHATQSDQALQAIEALNADNGVGGVLTSNIQEIRALSFPGDANDEPPIADAGPAQQVNARALVTLNGANSRDVDTQGPQTVTFAWRQTGGPTVALSSPTAARPTFVAPPVDLGTTLIFALRVTDNEGSFAEALSAALVTISPVNLPPIAATGPAQTVRARAVVTLDGSQSVDPEGTPLTFSWRQTLGPAVTLTGATGARPTFIAPVVGGTSTALTFELLVTDTGGLMATATAVVNVLNSPPVANAGPTQTVIAGQTVTLDASQSSDPEETPLTFSWRQTAGPSVPLSDATAVRPTFVAPAIGEGSAALAFELRVTDAGGLTATALALVNVSTNLSMADAGPSQIVVEGALVTLDGSRSRDSQGNSVTRFLWRQLSGPPVTLSDVTAVRPTFIAPAVSSPSEVLTFELRITDGQGLTSTTLTTVQVQDDAPPVARTGPEQTVSTGTVVTLDGSQSLDPQGTPLLFAWSQGEGPPVTLSDPTAIRPTFVAPAVGEGTVRLTFTLRVTDAGGLTATAMTVVNVSRNTLMADAGAAQTVVAGTVVTLDGARSRDGQGHPVTRFLWRQLSGPPVTLSDVMVAQPTFLAPAVSALGELLTFELRITDSQGLIGTATAVVQVLPSDTAPGQDGGDGGERPGDGTPDDSDVNQDGIPDVQQANVVSLRDSVRGHTLTLFSPTDTQLVNVRFIDNPSPRDVPPGVTLPLNFLTFTVQGLAVREVTTVTLVLPPGVQVNTYLSFGPTPTLALPHWYRLTFSDTVGLVIGQGIVELHLMDGREGDNDVTADGRIVAVGTLALQRSIATDDGGGEGGGHSSGGGCTLAPGAERDLTLPGLLLGVLISLAWHRVGRKDT